MADQNLFQERQKRLDNLFKQQDRRVEDLSKTKLTEAFQKDELSQTEKEIEEIDQLLEQTTVDASMFEKMDQETKNSKIEEQRKIRYSLHHRKMMDQAHILVNEHSKSDSLEMQDVKDTVLRLAEVIDTYKNQPMTQEVIDEVQLGYSAAVAACKAYVDSKNPYFKKGKIRKKMVENLLGSLALESVLMRKLSKEIGPDQDITLGALLNIPAEEQQVQMEPVMAEKVEENLQQDGGAQPAEEKISVAAAAVVKLFKEDIDIKDEILRAGKKKDKKADQFKAMRDVLRGFPPYQVEVRDVVIMGKKVRLGQNSSNDLFIMEGSKRINLDLNAQNMITKIESSVIRDTELFGKNYLNSVLSDHLGMPEFKDEYEVKRGTIVNYVSRMIGEETNFFNMVTKTELDRFAKALYAGNMTAEQVKSEVKKQNQKARESGAIYEVSYGEMIKLRERNEFLHANSQQKDKEINYPKWNEGEEQVKGLLADLIFTNDFMMMQESVSDPANFMRKMLSNHKAALLKLLTSKEDMVDEVLKGMSLDEVAGEVTVGDKKVKTTLTEVIKQSLDSIKELLVNQMQRFFTGEVLEEYKDKSDNVKLDIILSQGKSFSDTLVEVKKKLDASVDQTCEILQANVSAMTDVIFPEEEEQKKDELKEPQNLQKMIDESLQSKKGMGKFLRTTMKNYFGKVENIDKRSMISAVFRYAEKITDSVETDDELIEEVKKLDIKEYRGVFDVIDKEKGLTKEQKEKVAEYRERKQTLKKQANYFGGLIRGAGPLLQKTMQGLDRAPLPPEILRAISDMKSNLPPIPEDAVKAEFNNIISSSKGKIKSIDYPPKSLGAASVGQTFLCTLRGKGIGPDGSDSREVVIKLLRPDAKVRMEREEKVMLDCAKQTDEAMYLTYQGQLRGFYEEIDLTTEGKNCDEAQKRYGDKYYTEKFNIKDVDTMKTVKLVEPSSRSLIVEKAKGENVANYIENLEGYVDEQLKQFYKIENKDGVEIINKRITNDGTKLKERAAARNNLVKKLNEAIKRRDHLTNLANIWIDQAIMKDDGGFFHGDLHAGNIMIDDNTATFIDYGNTMTLDRVQQNAIAKMTIATLGSVKSYDDEGKQMMTDDCVELFMDAFNDVIEKDADPQFKEKYQGMKDDIKAEFTKILKLGDSKEGAKRCYACILKAQEMGVQIPAAIQRFIEGEVRLQNAVNRMNDAIKSLKDGIKSMEAPEGMRTADAVSMATGNVFSKAALDNKVGAAEKHFDTILNEIKPIEKDKFTEELNDKDGQEEFREKYYNRYSTLKSLKNFKPKEIKEPTGELSEKDKQKLMIKRHKNVSPLKLMGIDELTKEEKALGIKNFRETTSEFLKKWKQKKIDTDNDASLTPEQKKDIYDKISDDAAVICEIFQEVFTAESGEFDEEGEAIPALQAFGAENMYTKVYDALRNMNESDIDDVIDIFENQTKAALDMVDNIDKYFEKGDSYAQDEKEQQAGKIFDSYSKLFMSNVKNTDIMSRFTDKVKQANNLVTIEKELEGMFKEEEGLGEDLMQKFKAFSKLSKEVVTYENSQYSVNVERRAEYNAALDELLTAYHKVAVKQIERFKKDTFVAKAEADSGANFDTVTNDVVDQNTCENGTFSISKSVDFGVRLRMSNESEGNSFTKYVKVLSYKGVKIAQNLQ